MQDPAGEDATSAFTSAGALIPPYALETLCLLVEHSNSLRQNVESYVASIDGNGYRFYNLNLSLDVIEFKENGHSYCDWLQTIPSDMQRMVS